MSTPRVVLWDLEHTLIDTGGLTRQLYTDAFNDVFGIRCSEFPHNVGVPERAVLRQTLCWHGLIPTESALLAFHAAVARRCHEALSDGRFHQYSRILPGVLDTLEHLRQQPILHTVYTDNVRPLVQAKLHATGLDQHLVVDCGAYGDDTEHRHELIPTALQSCRARLDTPVAGEDVVVLGDAPANVHAARQAGARMAAVATGFHSPEQLRTAGAATVLPDMSIPSQVDTVLRHARTPALPTVEATDER